MLRLLAVVSFATSLAACATSGVVYTPRPFPVPGGGYRFGIGVFIATR